MSRCEVTVQEASSFHTVSAPSRICTPRRAVATSSSRRSGSPAAVLRQAATASPMKPSVTVAASARCDHSNPTSRFIRGSHAPKQSGQSGQARPAPCARTSAPSTISAAVIPTSSAKPAARPRAATARPRASRRTGASSSMPASSTRALVSCLRSSPAFGRRCWRHCAPCAVVPTMARSRALPAARSDALGAFRGSTGRKMIRRRISETGH